jgi:16S rRNA (adenine1518-N6/adenine1519-N6)-dimethyltransferase
MPKTTRRTEGRRRAAPRVRRRFGQHYLEPPWVVKLVDAIGARPDDLFLEIGPGKGALTLPLAERAAFVVAIEIDRDLVSHLRPLLPANVSLVCGDVLESDLAALLEQTAAHLPTPPGAIRVVGNLPYNVSSPILFQLLALQGRSTTLDATLMLQREVADRLVAAPGSAEYGVLSVLVQLRANVMRLLTLPPGAFRPAPAVTSAVLRLTFHPPQVALPDPRLFERLVRSIFTQRRKTLGNALKPFAAPSRLSAAAALREAAIDPRRRPETLELVELARLAEVLAAAGR